MRLLFVGEVRAWTVSSRSGSIAVTIPKALCRGLGVKPGDTLKVYLAHHEGRDLIVLEKAEG